MSTPVSKGRNWPYILFGVTVVPNILYLGHLLTPSAPAVPPWLRWLLFAALAAGFAAFFAALFTDPRLRKDPQAPVAEPARGSATLVYANQPHPVVAVSRARSRTRFETTEDVPRPRLTEERTEPIATGRLSPDEIKGFTRGVLTAITDEPSGEYPLVPKDAT